MDFEIFQSKVVILDKEEGNSIRNKYIEEFVNTEGEYYKKQIQTLHKFSDGYCYLEYLWDCIKNPVIVDIEDIKELVKNMGTVYVFWDINSCERILIENYWRFEKDAVLKLEFATLIEGEKYLPEDIYIVDKNIKWTLIKTHEDIERKCYCIKNGNI